MGNYDSKSSVINNVIYNVMDTDNLKLNKILKNRYNNNIDKEIEKILDNFNINTCDKEGQNLLHIFARSDKILLLRMLVDRGCDINKKDNLGNTPIFYSSENTIEFFINNGTNLNITNNNGHTVLYKKSKSYYTNSVKILFNAQKCENIYEQFEPYELLHKAVLFQDIPKMKELITQNKFLVNAVIEHPNNHESESIKYLTPLSITCRNGLYDEFLCLIENGADIHRNNLLINISYYWTISKNHINIIKKLIELGANVNDIDDNGENVLHKLYASKNVELFEIFLKAGTDIHAKTLVKSFINQPFNYNIYSHLLLSDATPLQNLSVFNSNIEIYKKLFEYGADPNIQNNYGVNAFMGVCCNEFFRYDNDENVLEVIKLFIENGVDIHLTDIYGNTALDIIVHNHRILNKDKIKIIEYLHEKFKFIVPKSLKTNEFLYDVLVNRKYDEK